MSQPAATAALSTAQLLYGETLVWITVDHDRIVSAALRSMLTEQLQTTGTRLDWIVAGSLDEAVALVELHLAGLLTLVLRESDDEMAVWRALRRVQSRRPQCVRCVHLRKSDLQLGQFNHWDRLRLMETGAQIVIEQIPWYRQALATILAHAPRRTGGNHPLTIGLIDRLPWA